MRCHTGRHNIHRVRLVQAADDAELLDLILHIQSVTTLNLRRGHAKVQLLIKKPHRAGKQFILTKRARLTHCVEDSTARLQDVEITRTLELERNLVLPPAAEDEVRMRIHPAGSHKRAARIQPPGVRRARRKRPVLRDRDDGFAVDEHARVVILPVFALRKTPQARVADGGLQKRDVIDEEHVSPSIMPFKTLRSSTAIKISRD